MVVILKSLRSRQGACVSGGGYRGLFELNCGQLLEQATLFAVSLPAADAPEPDQLALGRVAADVVAEAIVSAIRAATPLHGIPSATT